MSPVTIYENPTLWLYFKLVVRIPILIFGPFYSNFGSYDPGPYLLTNFTSSAFKWLLNPIFVYLAVFIILGEYFPGPGTLLSIKNYDFNLFFKEG